MVDPIPPDMIEVEYQKSNFFRVIHADGAMGAPSPRGILNFAFYSERSPLPRKTVIPVINKHPGPEQTIETKRGLIRELEVNVAMDLAVAMNFHAWLGDRIIEIQTQLEIPKEVLDKMKGGAA